MATQTFQFTSPTANDLGLMAGATMSQARRTSGLMRTHLVSIARQQWRSALRYEMTLVQFGAATSQECVHVTEYGDHAWTNDVDYAMHCVECGLVVKDSRRVVDADA